MKRLLVTILCLASAALVGATRQVPAGGGGGNPPRYTVSGLPTPGIFGRLVVVYDASTATTCATGGGGFEVLCMDNGASWERPFGSGTGDQIAVNTVAAVDPDIADTATIDAVLAANVITFAVKPNSIAQGQVVTDGIGVDELDTGGLDATGGKFFIKVDNTDLSQFELLTINDFRNEMSPPLADLNTNSFNGNLCGGDPGGGDPSDDCSTPTWEIINATGVAIFQGAINVDDIDQIGTGSMDFGTGGTAPTLYQFLSDAGYLVLDNQVTMQERASVADPTAGWGTVYVKNTTPSSLVYVNDANDEINLSAGFSGELDDIADPDSALSDFIMGDGELVEFDFTTASAGSSTLFLVDANWTSASTNQTAMAIAIDLEGAAGSPQGLLINNEASAANRSLSKALIINHAEDIGTMTKAISIEGATADKILTAVDLSSAGVLTALALGENDITVNAKTISAVEFGRLDGKDEALVDTNDSVTWTGSSHIFDGIQLEIPNDVAGPVAGDCDDDAEAGRVHIDTSAQDGLFYVCNGAAVGWVGISGLGGGGDSPWTDADPIVHTTGTTGRDFVIGDGAGNLSGKVEIGGTDDNQPVLVIEADDVQGDSVVIVQNDADTQVFNVDVDGTIKAQSIIDIDGTVWEVQADGDAFFKSVTITPDGSPSVTFRDSDTTIGDVDIDASIEVNADVATQNDENATMTFKVISEGGPGDDGTIRTTVMQIFGDYAASNAPGVKIDYPLVLSASDPPEAGQLRFDSGEGIRWEGTTEGSLVVDGSNNLVLANINAIDLGTNGVRFVHDGDGRLEMLGLGDGTNDFDESLRFNLMDTANTVVIDSGTGVTLVDFSALNLLTTGTIRGAVDVIVTTGGSASPTMLGQMYMADHDTATSDTTYTLPGAAAGLSACFYDNGDGGGGIILDPVADDHIQLDGLDAANDENVNSPGVAGAGANGDFICLLGVSTTEWITLGQAGDWVEATP